MGGRSSESGERVALGTAVPTINDAKSDAVDEAGVEIFRVFEVEDGGEDRALGESAPRRATVDILSHTSTESCNRD